MGYLGDPMPTSTVEDYLKRILQEEQHAPGQRVPTGQIASALGVTPGTATTMVKTLADAGLVEYEPYAGVRLTEAGTRLAAHVVRRHRLIELFLVRILGMSWGEVHEEAEILEHAVSDRLIERMDEMLGRPEVDPHGDPIPSPEGKLPGVPDYPSLLLCPLGAPVRLARVTDQRTDFLHMLDRHGLVPGRQLVVVLRDELADTVEVQPEDARPLRLGFRAASRVLVEPVD